MTKENSLSLLDIGPMKQQVKYGEQFIDVHGISAKGVFELFERFPQLKNWFTTPGGVKPADLFKEGPDAIAAIIAAGCGCPGNKGAEENAASLPLEVQLDILEVTARLTFRSGFGPFVERLVGLANAAQAVNYGKVPGMTSPQPSKPSPQSTAETTTQSGT